MAEMTSKVESATWKPTLALPDQGMRRLLEVRTPSFRCGVDLGVGGAPRGGNAEGHPGDEGHGGGEAEDAPVESDGHLAAVEAQDEVRTSS
jgi:hypothetical protein